MPFDGPIANCQADAPAFVLISAVKPLEFAEHVLGISHADPESRRLCQESVIMMRGRLSWDFA
jgi:hypothetical protein